MKRPNILACAVLSAAWLAAGSARATPNAPTINLDVRGASLRNVLSSLAEFGQVSLVIAEGIDGKVTVRLRNVPWSEAFEAIARSHGLGLVRTENIIFVDRLERLAAYDAAQLDRQHTDDAAARLVTRVFKLSFARAADLAPVVRALLGDRGRVAVDRRTNSLIVTGVPGRVSRVAARLGR